MARRRTQVHRNVASPSGAPCPTWNMQDATTEDLLAVLCADGTDVRALLSVLGDLVGLSESSVDEIANAMGARDIAAARPLCSAFELGRRVAQARAAPPAVIRDAEDVARWAVPHLGSLKHEELWLLAVDGRSRLRAHKRIAMGGIHGAAVRAADPLRAALRVAASGFVLVHNHPSGDPTPSPEDVRFTAAVAAAAVVVGVPLLDHVVVAGGASSSVPFASPPTPSFA